ncbi:Endonuclease/exonuclease/phosphatase, partial [Gymnopilus junonius]
MLQTATSQDIGLRSDPEDAPLQTAVISETQRTPQTVESLQNVEEAHNTPEQTLNRRKRRAYRRNLKKAAIKIASINIRGYGGNGQSHHPENKWNHINQVMREKKIAILAIQETHLDETRQRQLHQLFGKRMKIYYSSNLETPTRKEGVAIVINKQLLDTTQTQEKSIIPGRAMMIKTKWHRDKSIKILTVYAPNDYGENKDFWLQIGEYFRNNPTQKPDIMLGDFNMVENAMDRLPMHGDQEEILNQFDNLKLELRLSDGWHNTFPDHKTFTFTQNNEVHSQSRIDRIYTTNNILKTAREWQIEISGIPHADHRMVSVKITDDNTPEIGQGRWSIPIHLIKDKPLQTYIQERGKEIEEKISRCINQRTNDQNPQVIYAAFKKDIKDMARRREKAIVPKIIQQI